MLKKIIRSGFIHIFTSEVLNKIIIFFSGIILVRVIPKNEYGSYAYAQNIYNFFMIATGMGLSSGMLQICCEKEKKEGWEYFKKGSRYAVLFNLILQLIIFISASTILLPLKSANLYLKFLSLLPVACICVDLIQIYNRYTIQNQKYAGLSIANTIFVFGMGVLGALFFKVIGLIVFQCIGYILTVFFATKFQKFPLKDLAGKTSNYLIDWGIMVKISLVSILNNSASVILYNLDIFILGLVMTEESIVASYKIATYIPNALSFIPTALIIYIYPYFAQNSQNIKWVDKNYNRLIKWFALFNAGIVGVLIIFAPFIIEIFFGAQYLDAIKTFRILTVSYFFNATFRNTTGNILASQRRYKTNLFIGILSGALNAIGDFILVNMYGGEGAALTTLLVTLFSSVTMVICFKYYVHKKQKNI